MDDYFTVLFIHVFVKYCFCSAVPRAVFNGAKDFVTWLPKSKLSTFLFIRISVNSDTINSLKDVAIVNSHILENNRK